ncbi:MAG: methionyl-tRNA formyltransferase [Halofilum sp. (in: g-proteobacteria)]|nr:methionyl-tRNA formyltransferase [Halofilum sp. (in: g-proteobacteria)]
MNEPLRIVFAGTPAFAVPSLETVIDSAHELVGVVSQPDRPAGRGRRLTAPPVKEAAEAAGLTVIQPERLSGTDLEALCAGERPDLLVVVAFGQVLPAAVLEFARHGAINVHASLLPRWRGAAPIARALLAGDEETGVSIMQMTSGLDAGPVLLQHRCPIREEDTAATLHDRLASLGASALRTVIDDLTAHLDRARPQDEAAVTHAAKLSRDEALVDWTAPASEIERRVRALQPWPVAWTRLEGDALRIWSAQAVGGGAPGDVLPGTIIGSGRAGIDVTTGGGLLRLLSVQPPGRRPMTAGDFANAREVEGCRLGA